MVDHYTYSISLLWSAEDLTNPVQTVGEEQIFVIETGDSVVQISNRLESMGLIRNSNIFRIYLVWKGLDTTVQAGSYKLKSSMNGIEIASALQDATPSEVIFNILAGWRLEEIAASLPTSGLKVTPEEFIEAVRNPNHPLDYFPEGASAEGFLFPGSYSLARDMTADQLVSTLLQNFSVNMSSDLQGNISRQGLDIYNTVILASIIEREAIVPDEQPMIASVFFNRLNNGMKLDSDPTVQYAIGYDNLNGTWWKNPLTLDDLTIDSPFNTYKYSDLPPAPISNPNLSAIQAVAFPAETPYFYFRARCDGSGLHAFAETFEQHLQNACK
ncbi:MAG: hypothetical protein A2X25_13615 [Chloroflexi bacterium GWB2_49_20]|nr:MAG: hypothetical protein A2X25_13615 [Chloroflexi bacterium GWB2_49_20]OGN80076.1 MAG: hypothetical protein A2X26_03135 [Chloroflexi bacterium GWC2_49_37]OGN85636.1 MAG: hypothetical protein A2X27_03925 [Chloroflexi bacterium GWD2_49_16]